MNYTINTIKPTHKVSFYGVRCYYDDKTDTLWGVNRFCDLCIPVVTWWHNTIAVLFPGAKDDGFPFYVLEEYSE